MNNAINNQFKMKMGSKQKDTEGAFSEKDTSLMKKAPLLSIANALKAQESIDAEKGNPFEEIGDNFMAGAAEREELMSGQKKTEGGGEYADKFASMSDNMEDEKKKGLGIDIGAISGLMGDV